jgi:GntR family transcriptional repressor for pyruvate dehydrogenase complex
MTVAAPRFAPVDRRTLAHEVRDRLYEAIKSGTLPPGAVIPSERSLCEDFAVARTSVREAIQGLFSLGLLERRGNRTVVAERLPEMPLDVSDQRKLEVRELFEVRQAMEVAIVRLAVERANESERAAIADIAARFSTTMAVEKFRALDRSFHWSLARACGNELLAELFGKVLDRLFQSQDFDDMLNAQMNRRAVRQLVRDSCKGHQAIAKALLNGRQEGVVTAVEEHLKQVENHLVARLI